MDRIIITVLSDDIEKSKRFAEYLAGDGIFEVDRETKDELILKYGIIIIKVIKPHEGQRCHRHHKLYVDSTSPRTVELVQEMFQYKILPIYSPLCRFKLEVKNEVEYLDFDKEIANTNYNR